MKVIIFAIMYFSFFAQTSLVDANSEESASYIDDPGEKIQFAVPEQPSAPHMNRGIEFVSGEVLSYDPDESRVRVQTFLDENGEPSNRIIEVFIDQDTLIASEEGYMDALNANVAGEIDVEYRIADGKAIYFYIYS